MRIRSLLVFSALFFAAPAVGHEIVGANGVLIQYQNWVDPVTGVNCCSGNDCDPFPAANVKPGYDSSGKFGFTILTTSEWIPIERALPSPDGEYHRCEFYSDVPQYKAKKGDTRCFAAPLGQY